MAIGDNGALQGMPLVAGSTAANTIDTELNRIHDYIADKAITNTRPVNRGGTGATTAAGARTNLDVFSKDETVNTNGTNNIEMQWTGSHIQFFVDGVFRFQLP